MEITELRVRPRIREIKIGWPTNSLSWNRSKFNWAVSQPVEEPFTSWNTRFKEPLENKSHNQAF